MKPEHAKVHLLKTGVCPNCHDHIVTFADTYCCDCGTDLEWDGVEISLENTGLKLSRDYVRQIVKDELDKMMEVGRKSALELKIKK